MTTKKDKKDWEKIVRVDLSRFWPLFQIYLKNSGIKSKQSALEHLVKNILDPVTRESFVKMLDSYSPLKGERQ